MNYPRGHWRNSTKYKKLRKMFKKRFGSVGRCALCGGSIDMSLPGTHKWGFTVDHLYPPHTGVDPLDTRFWQPAHRDCNQRAFLKLGDSQRREPESPNG